MRSPCQFHGFAHGDDSPLTRLPSNLLPRSVPQAGLPDPRLLLCRARPCGLSGLRPTNCSTRKRCGGCWRTRLTCRSARRVFPATFSSSRFAAAVMSRLPLFPEPLTRSSPPRSCARPGGSDKLPSEHGRVLACFAQLSALRPSRVVFIQPGSQQGESNAGDGHRTGGRSQR